MIQDKSRPMRWFGKGSGPLQRQGLWALGAMGMLQTVAQVAVRSRAGRNNRAVYRYNAAARKLDIQVFFLIFLMSYFVQ
jgi:hypothetical protein